MILSGGSNTKRHILSTTDYRLAQFIACHDGARICNVFKSFFKGELEIKTKQNKKILLLLVFLFNIIINFKINNKRNKD
jgi:hypothetical protein